MSVGSLVMSRETEEVGLVLAIEVPPVNGHPAYKDTWILALWSGGTIEATITDCVKWVQ